MSVKRPRRLNELIWRPRAFRASGVESLEAK